MAASASRSLMLFLFGLKPEPTCASRPWVPASLAVVGSGFSRNEHIHRVTGTTFNVTRNDDRSGRVAADGERLNGSDGVSSSTAAVTSMMVPRGSGIGSRNQ